MAYDEGIAAILQAALVDEPGIDERTLFGVRAFMLNGNMLTCARMDGAMFRVGKAQEAEALLTPGTEPFQMGKRRMGGVIVVAATVVEDDVARGRLFTLALDYNRALPAK